MSSLSLAQSLSRKGPGQKSKGTGKESGIHDTWPALVEELPQAHHSPASPGETEAASGQTPAGGRARGGQGQAGGRKTGTSQSRSCSLTSNPRHRCLERGWECTQSHFSQKRDPEHDAQREARADRKSSPEWLLCIPAEMGRERDISTECRKATMRARLGKASSRHLKGCAAGAAAVRTQEWLRTHSGGCDSLCTQGPMEAGAGPRAHDHG